MKIDKIIRTKRKTISLVVNAEGQLIIRAPLAVPKHYIEDLVVKKTRWIEEKQGAAKEKHALRPPKLVQDGEKFTYLGTDYLLLFSETVREIKIDHEFLLVPGTLGDTKKAIITWYKEQAKTVISERVRCLASQTGLSYKSVKITSASKRWGSCSKHGALNFTWRLVACPLRVVDYVAIHELVHTKHHNHSQEFWGMVRTILPDYEVCKKWLTDNQHLISMLS